MKRLPLTLIIVGAVAVGLLLTQITSYITVQKKTINTGCDNSIYAGACVTPPLLIKKGLPLSFVEERHLGKESLVEYETTINNAKKVTSILLNSLGIFIILLLVNKKKFKP